MVRRQETGQGRRVHRDHRQTDRVPAWLYLSFQSCQRCCLLQEVLSLTRLSQAAPLGTPCPRFPPVPSCCLSLVFPFHSPTLSR